MATPRKVGGPAHRREINRAVRANHYARAAMGRILEEQPGAMRLSQLLTEITHQLGIELEALTEMKAIIEGGESEETVGGESSNVKGQSSNQAGGPEQKGE